MDHEAGKDTSNMDKQLLTGFLEELHDVLKYIIENRKQLLPSELRESAFKAWLEVEPQFPLLKTGLEGIDIARLEEAGLTGAQLSFKILAFSSARERLNRLIPPQASTPSKGAPPNTGQVRAERAKQNKGILHSIGQGFRSLIGRGRDFFIQGIHWTMDKLSQLRKNQLAQLIGKALVTVLKSANIPLGSLANIGKVLPGGEIIKEFKETLELGISEFFDL